MWFKNLALYRFSEDFTLSADDMQHKLAQQRFQPCGSQDEFSFGWTAPQAKGEEDALVYAANGFMLICGKKEEKVIPSSVINEMLHEKISEMEVQEMRKLPAKERARVKDELIFELLPRAFSFSKKTYAYIDPKGGWVVVDAASPKKAEDLLSQLRRCLGSLPVAPLVTTVKPSFVMTQWLLGEGLPKEVLIEDECELKSQEDEAAIVRCKRHDLTLPEIKNHLDSGKQVTKLALNWTDRLSFVLDEHLAIKRLKFLDLVQEQRQDIETANEAEQFDADFAIMTAELAEFFPHLVEWFNEEA